MADSNNPSAYIPLTVGQLRVLLPDFMLARPWMAANFTEQAIQRRMSTGLMRDGFLGWLGVRKARKMTREEAKLSVFRGEYLTGQYLHEYGLRWQDDAEALLGATEFLDDDHVVNVNAACLSVWNEWTELWRDR